MGSGYKMNTTLNKPDIIEVIGKEIELKQRGRNFIGLCPFHSEKTPSFVVNPERQRWKCFGACNEGGDVISFIQRLKGLSFENALQYLGISGDASQVKPNPRELKKRELVRKFRRWIQLYRRAICELLRLANRIDLQVTTPEHLDLPNIAEMYIQKEICEYHLSILNGDDDKSKFELFKEVTHGND